MEDYHRFLLERAERTFKGGSISQFTQRIRAIIGPQATKLEGLAKEAIEALGVGEVPTPRQLAALEEVIRSMRPAPLSKGGVLENLDPEVTPCFTHWNTFSRFVKPILYSIGRIDRVPDIGVGTGFLIAGDLFVTNKHVLDELSRGTYVLEEGQAIVRFRYEYGSPDEDPVPIVSVAAVHPDLDMALLRLDRRAFADSKQPLSVDSGKVKAGHPVVAIGYPFNDPSRNPLFIGGIFGDRFGVKRAAPGEIIGLGPRTVFHDCSTLGGNSGSPILSMETVKVVGIHRDGMFRYRNEAVDGASLSDFIGSYS